MSDTQDFRSDLEMYMGLWDELQGIQPPSPPAEEGRKSQILGFGTSPPAEEQDAEIPQDDAYFAYSELLQEQKTPNPVYPDSVGKDDEQPKPVWASEDLLKEVESLKQKLFDVENRMAQLGGDKKVAEKPVEESNKLMSEIETLRKKIDKVSDQLGIKDEPSPWRTEAVK